MGRAVKERNVGETKTCQTKQALAMESGLAPEGSG